MCADPRLANRRTSPLTRRAGDTASPPGRLTPGCVDALACHRAVAGAARWHIRRRGGPHDGASERSAGGARLGTNRAPARPPQAGEFTVARTCVLIKTASHPDCTCVLITLMSQPSYGPWPRSDVIPRCRQNGCGSLPRVVGHLVTCHDRRGDAGASCPGGAAAGHRLDGEVMLPGSGGIAHPGGAPRQSGRGGALRHPWRPHDGEPGPADSSRFGPRTGRARQAARVGVTAGRPRRPGSLPVPRSRQRTAVDGGARPRLPNARAPC